MIRKYSSRLRTIPITVNNIVIDLPAPRPITTYWNFGSILGFALTIQMGTGIFLAIYYAAHAVDAFSSVIYIVRDVPTGWLLRNTHANGASVYFIFIYIHIARGLFFGSYARPLLWVRGITIFITSIATAFIGYLLPWGQIRFWGATVITNLVTAAPYCGKETAEWIWGAYNVRGPTLTRFFSLHYLIPFLLTAIVILHLILLHKGGSTNPLGLNSKLKAPFHEFFLVKDIVGFLAVLFLIIAMTSFSPTKIVDPENFCSARALLTPEHIKPEWYFLWVYAILRSIPSKWGGVALLVAALLILYLLPIKSQIAVGTSHCWISTHLVKIFILDIIVLSYVGASPVEEPYVYIGSVATMTYFICLTLMAYPQFKDPYA